MAEGQPLIEIRKNFPLIDDRAAALESRIDTLLREGDKITASRYYRQLTGTGLKEAKDAVERRERALGVGR